MVGTVLAISLLGLGVVQALPRNLQGRQGFVIGDPISPGGPFAGLPKCNPDVPPEQQEACLYEPVSGEMKPSPKKRDAATLATLQVAYENAVASLNGHQPSLETSIILSKAQDALSAGGLTFTPISSTFQVVPRQQTIGCRPADVLLLNILWRSYDDDLCRYPRLPTSERDYIMATLHDIAALLVLCGEDRRSPRCSSEGTRPVPTGPRLPGSTISGGPMVPATPIPGGRIEPVPTSYPGGRIEPVPTISGGRLEPVPTGGAGGWLEPAPTIPGGELKPGKRSPESELEKRNPDGVIEPVETIPGGTIEPVEGSSGGKIAPVPTIPGGKIQPAGRSTEEPRDLVVELKDGVVWLGKPRTGPFVPAKPIPGGKIKPVPTIPGGKIKPAGRSTEEPRDLVAELKDGIVKLGDPKVGKIVPVKPIPGGKIVPVPTTPGGKIKPATRDAKDDIFIIGEPQVGKIVPVKPIPGGKLKPVLPTPGGKIKPATREAKDDIFIIGEPQVGKIVPVKPIPGGKIKPATREAKDDIFIIGEPVTGKIVPVKPIPGGKIRPAD